MKPLSQINVIPFIDIMLVLLAVVLTTATFVAQGKIPVSLPQASQAEPLVPAATVEITIDSEGRAYLADKPITLEQIAEQLAAVRDHAVLQLADDRLTV